MILSFTTYLYLNVRQIMNKLYLDRTMVYLKGKRVVKVAVGIRWMRDEKTGRFEMFGETYIQEAMVVLQLTCRG